MLVQNDDGWFVINVRDAPWVRNESFGSVCSFEDRGERFPDIGIHLYVLEPGKPNCRYHRESAQENMLVLVGECRLLINDEQRELRAGDFVHCPPGVSHVMVGAGDGPCTVLMIGHRPETEELCFPSNEMARRHGAEAPRPTADPRVAYSDVEPRTPVDPPEGLPW